MVETLSVASRIGLTDGLVSYTLAGAWAFLVAVAILAGSFAFIRTAVMGNLQDPVMWGLRLILVVCCLASYNQLFGAMLSASHSMTIFFIEKASWDEFSVTIMQQFEPIFDESSGGAGDKSAPSMWERLTGVLRGSILTVVTAVTYYLVFMLFEFMRSAAAVVGGFLRIAGPFMVAAGILGNGQTLRQWFSATIQVLLWPVVPPFMMMMIINTSGLAAPTGNTAFIIQQNLAITFLTILTPLIVAFMFGRGGVATFGVAMGAVTYKALTGAASIGAAIAKKAVGGAAGGAAGAAGGSGGGGGGGGSAPQTPVRRPGDEPASSSPSAAAEPPAPARQSPAACRPVAANHGPRPGAGAGATR